MLAIRPSGWPRGNRFQPNGPRNRPGTRKFVRGSDRAIGASLNPPILKQPNHVVHTNSRALDARVSAAHSRSFDDVTVGLDDFGHEAKLLTLPRCRK